MSSNSEWFSTLNEMRDENANYMAFGSLMFGAARPPRPTMGKACSLLLDNTPKDHIIISHFRRLFAFRMPFTTFDFCCRRSTAVAAHFNIICLRYDQQATDETHNLGAQSIGKSVVNERA